ncbi:MAG TPA: hypothetical protein VFN41_12485 [Candidatus Limnocylindrales bacterium]|nr:hypothetical protein [Candidatus Limnocylindrales bacterium]
MRVCAASLVLTLLVLGCTSTPAGQPVSPVVTSAKPPATASSITPPASATAPIAPSAVTVETAAPGDVPPEARLAVEGGDPVAGQLGTYVWDGQGSDSPWLPGAAIAVGRGEPLTVRVRPAADVDSWSARIVRADSSGPDGATPLGEGTGTPRFDAPARGAWTLEVHLAFGDDAGDASYFWRLDVR